MPDVTENFTAAERNLIRTEFMLRWGLVPSLDEGITLLRWAGGPHKGQPKLKAPVQSMLARGLVEIVNPERGIPCALFTAAGLAALQAMAKNRTFLPPAQYQHLIEELQKRASSSAASPDAKPAPAGPTRKKQPPRKK